MNFGLHCENDKGGYVVLNDVRIADIRSLRLFACLLFTLACIAYCTFAAKQAVSFTAFGLRSNNNNKN